MESDLGADDFEDDPPISQFMNRDVLSGERTMPLRDAIRKMTELRKSELVVCESGFPIGILTERDTLEVLDEMLHSRAPRDLSVAAVMASPIHTLPESATMREVVQIMTERRFRRVPIVDERSELSGIVNLLELQAAMNALLDKRRSHLERIVSSRTAELREANARLQEQSEQDELTGLPNRRALTRRLEVLDALFSRYGNAYSLIVCDIDHFKKLNDRLGHLEGDRALEAVARVLRGQIRDVDTAYRFGGEEFIVLLPETPLEGGAGVADRIREAIRAEALPNPDSTIGGIVTMSLGVAEVAHAKDPSQSPSQATIARADQALYAAKEAGRDRVFRAD